MSSHASSPKDLATRLLQATALVFVFALLYGATRVAPQAQGTLPTIAAVGFLLLAGTLTSELLEVIGLPHITGYLAAGVLAGPQVLNLVDHDTVVRLTQVNALALALIALAGGAELRLETLKRVFRSIAYATLIQSTFVFVVVAAVFVALRPMMGFVRAMTLLQTVGVAILWGVLAISRSPSATLGILSQTKARGPVADFTLGFVMTSDIVVVIVLAAASTVARPLLEAGAELSAAAFRNLGYEILGSVSIGTTLGLLLALYMRLVGRQLLVVLIAIGFGLTEVLAYLRFDPLLTFMVAGFVVSNLTNLGEAFLDAVSDASGVVFVLFFASAGAHLDLALVSKFWLVTLLLAGSRALATMIAARMASVVADDPPGVRRWGWGGLLSQAGLTLGLSSVIERQYPAFGTDFRSLVLATVALNEVLGPIFFKLALDRAGESQREPEVAHGAAP